MIEVENLGLIEYSAALKIQNDRVATLSEGKGCETLLVCSHPSVVTLGRAAKPEDLMGWSGPVHEISRGGKATYHGPGQVVVYPILDLTREDRNHLKSRDLHAYLRRLELAIIDSLKSFDLQTAAQPSNPEQFPAEALATGVWLGNRKLASIGIGVRKWISFHGVAVNVLPDPKAFQGIRPCGFTTSTMWNLQDALENAGRSKPSALKEEYEKALTSSLIKYLS